MSVDRVLITGAAGRLGNALRERLRGKFELLRLSDRGGMSSAGPGEEVVDCDLCDYEGVKSMCQDIDAIVHLGAVARETSWPELTAGNITGTINVYEGARKAQVERVLFASSIAAVGFYRTSATLNHTTPTRPDGRYAATKTFGENLAMLYAFKHAVRGFVMRLGACRPIPTETIHLPIWLSYDDLASLVLVGLTADYVFEIVYGLSHTSNAAIDNRNAYRLGYHPVDSSDKYADAVSVTPPYSDVAAEFHGPFAGWLFSGNKDWAP